MGTQLTNPKKSNKEVESHTLPRRHIVTEGAHPIDFLGGLLLVWECNGARISALNSKWAHMYDFAWEVMVNGEEPFVFHTNENAAAFINAVLDMAEKNGCLSASSLDQVLFGLASTTPKLTDESA